MSFNANIKAAAAHLREARQFLLRRYSVAVTRYDDLVELTESMQGEPPARLTRVLGIAENKRDTLAERIDVIRQALQTLRYAD